MLSTCRSDPLVGSYDKNHFSGQRQKEHSLGRIWEENSFNEYHKEFCSGQE